MKRYEFHFPNSHQTGQTSNLRCSKEDDEEKARILQKEVKANCSSALLEDNLLSDKTERDSQTIARRVVSPVSWRSVAQECQSLSDISLPKNKVTTSGTYELKANVNTKQDSNVNFSHSRSSRAGVVRSYAHIKSIKHLPDETSVFKQRNDFGSVRSSTKLLVNNDIKTDFSELKLPM